MQNSFYFGHVDFLNFFLLDNFLSACSCCLQKGREQKVNFSIMGFVLTQNTTLKENAENHRNCPSVYQDLSQFLHLNL